MLVETTGHILRRSTVAKTIAGSCLAREVPDVLFRAFRDLGQTRAQQSTAYQNGEEVGARPKFSTRNVGGFRV